MARRPAIAREPRGLARPSSARGPADLPAKVGWPTARLPRNPRLAAELAGAGVDLLRAMWSVLPGCSRTTSVRTSDAAGCYDSPVSRIRTVLGLLAGLLLTFSPSLAAAEAPDLGSGRDHDFADPPAPDALDSP